MAWLTIQAILRRRIGNLHCISSMVWLTVQSIFIGEPLTFAVACMVNGKKLFGESNALHATMFLERNSFFVVCGEHSIVLWHIFKNILFS